MTVLKVGRKERAVGKGKNVSPTKQSLSDAVLIYITVITVYLLKKTIYVIGWTCY
jgi:hypothetical protein